jgi:hypothetical protein
MGRSEEPDKSGKAPCLLWIRAAGFRPRDLAHERGQEERFFCLGKVDGSILTVRFSYRDGQIRIYGAGFWRKGKKRYEQENKIH